MMKASHILLVLMISLCTFSTAVKAETLCSYPGPDLSEDLLRLTDFSVTGSSILREGDRITVKFNLQNFGQHDLNLGSEGIFVAAKDPEGEDASFGFTRANTVLRVGETVSIEASKTLDKDGNWLIWPSYHLSSATGEKFGPENWHGCSLVVLTAVRDSDKDGIADKKDNCPYKYNPKQKDKDKDGIGDLCDNCPTEYNPDQKDKNQNGIGDVCERDTTSPTVTINHYPVLDIYPTTNITFNVIATDDTNVTRIVIYVNGNATECSPIEYFWKDNYWQCTWNAGRFPAGTLTYRAEAFDPAGNRGISAEKILNVSGITPPELERPPIQPIPELPCFISGTIYDFKYYSKTLAVKACEAEVIEGGCLPTPPYTCLPPMTRCKEGGEVYYDTNLTRIWVGEERFRNPGPMEYHIYVPCNKSYLIQPVYQPYGDECQWQGSWRADKSNFVSATEPYAEDYDFHFEPMDLEGPSITQVIFPEDWDDLLSDEYFEIRVVGFDESGIKSIKLWLNVTTIGFISDESGPLEGVIEPVETLILNFSKECDTSECIIRNDEDIEPLVCHPDDPRGCYCIFGCIDDLIDQIFRIGMDNVAKIKLNLKVKICDVAGNSVMNSYEKTYPHFGDLRIISAEPVQVVYGAPLVKGKGTAFRVKAESTFGHAIETKFRLILPDDQWGIVSSTGNYRIGLPPEKWQEMHNQTWGPIKIEPGINEIIVPIIPDWKKDESDASLGSIIRGRCIRGVCGPDVRIMPKPIADRVSFSIEVDPDNEIRERSEANNVFNSLYYDVVTTKRWKFLFIPYLDKAGNCAPDLRFIEMGAKKQLEYLLANFPIADSKISYSIEPDRTTLPCSNNPSQTCGYSTIWETRKDQPNFETRSTFLNRIAREAKSEGYDFGVAIGCGSGGGAIGSSIDAVFIGDCGGRDCIVLAHEFNHAVTDMGDIYSLDCLVGWDEAYCEYPDGTRIYCCYDDGTINSGPYCEIIGGEVMCRGSYTENCVMSCGCSIYQKTEECKNQPTCDAGCCNNICRGICPGGIVYNGPDGRVNHPASEGFWVNRWIKIRDNLNYFMDIPAGPDFPYYWMRLNNTIQHCTNTTFADGYLNLLESNRFLSETDPEALLVSGKINNNGTAKLDPFTYLPNATLDIEPGRKGDYYFALLDENGNILSKSGFRVSFYMPDPYGGPIDEVSFVYRIEWKEGTKKIELQDKDGNVLASREVSPNKPEIKVLHPNGGEVFAKGEKIKIRWEASDKDNDALTSSLAISQDGENWLPIDIDIKANEYELNTIGLEEGEYLIKVRTTDGVNTAEDVSDGMFSIKFAPEKPKTQTQYPVLILGAIIGICIMIFLALKLKKKK